MSAAAERRGEVVIFPDPAAVARQAAAELLSRLERSDPQRPFTIALSGGSTPRLLFRELAAHAADPGLPWGRAHWFWGDERAVPPEHPESNFRLAREELLQHLPLTAEQVHRVPAELGAEAAAAAYEAQLRSFFASPPGTPPRFDLVFLGLGTDGHTASLFPASPALGESERWVVANPVASLGTTRITLTLPVLNAARLVIFLVTGADKAPALAGVLAGAAAAAVLPASRIAPATGELLWLVDRAAAARLGADHAGA